MSVSSSGLDACGKEGNNAVNGVSDRNAKYFNDREVRTPIKVAVEQAKHETEGRMGTNLSDDRWNAELHRIQELTRIVEAIRSRAAAPETAERTEARDLTRLSELFATATSLEFQDQRDEGVASTSEE
ncbi:hypothetical protein R1sor_013850 [Riccia sorocarpa]|uniref:Uncharacterized protein n=1 Tax=Riccia sorocarpa TaxID=122646 RepID=A0ABD3H9P2_9MARC